MGLFDSLFGSGGEKNRNQALDAIQDIPLPILKQINPELYQQVVTLNPSLMESASVGPSAMEGIALDPAYKAAQMQALSKLQSITENGGQDLQYQADTQNMVNNLNTQLKGREDAIKQEMAARGLSGGMSEMVSRETAAQNASNQAANWGLNIQAQAQQRALQALVNQGELAGQMSNQDFNQQATKANAEDAISKFNAQNLQSARQYNANARNDTNTWNAENQQTTANRNVDLRNRSNEWNTNGIAQANYENQMGKARGVASIYGDMAGAEDKNRDREANLWGNIISAGAQAYGSRNKGK